MKTKLRAIRIVYVLCGLLATEGWATYDEMLRHAFLGEEIADLKIYGHRGAFHLNTYKKQPFYRIPGLAKPVLADTLPMVTLQVAPVVDGQLDDVCWQQASHGEIRLVDGNAFSAGPFHGFQVAAFQDAVCLHLAIRCQRPIHFAAKVLIFCGKNVLTLFHDENNGWHGQRLSLNQWISGRNRKADTIPIERAAMNEDSDCFEFSLPRALFPSWPQNELAVAPSLLDMARAHFTFPHSPLSEYAIGNKARREVNRVLDHYRVNFYPGAAALRMDNAFTVTVIEQDRARKETAHVEATPLGDLACYAYKEDKQIFTIHGFRYCPDRLALRRLIQTVERLAAQGLDVSAERKQIQVFQQRSAALERNGRHGHAALRAFYFDLRKAGREAWFRDRALAGKLEQLLFVKRHPTHCSHNYSEFFDARAKPGGAVCALTIPSQNGRVRIDAADVRMLYDAGPDGYVKTPAVDYDGRTVFFSHMRLPQDWDKRKLHWSVCPIQLGYHHLFRLDLSTGAVRQLTEGPYNDAYPCPLPDGGLAFMSTRAKGRFLCQWPAIYVLHRMDRDGGGIRELSHANLTEWTASVMSDGRLIWGRSEYQDKGAVFGHTLWAVRPDGAHTELIFGNNTPGGYVSPREVPETGEIACVMQNHMGDLNGPIILIPSDANPFDMDAVTTLTPDAFAAQGGETSVIRETFRDPYPITPDHILCSHNPIDRFGLYLIDRGGHREILHLDPEYSCMAPMPLTAQPRPPVISATVQLTASADEKALGMFFVADVYQGLGTNVAPGEVKYIQVSQELRSTIPVEANGELKKLHATSQNKGPLTIDYDAHYATPCHALAFQKGIRKWPTYIAKASHGLVPVAEDGSASFLAPAGKVLYFHVLDRDFNEIQRMRSVVQLKPGEVRGCIGCHESRQAAPAVRATAARQRQPEHLQPPSWGVGPFSFERVVQPVLDAKCVRCHNGNAKSKVDLRGILDELKIPHSYYALLKRTDYISMPLGSTHSKREPKTFGVLTSPLWRMLNQGHHGVRLTTAEQRAIKCWTDLNCPLWPDNTFWGDRPTGKAKESNAEETGCGLGSCSACVKR